MHRLLNLYGGKLSYFRVLHAPPIEGGNGDAGGDAGGDGNGDSGAGQNNNEGKDGGNDDSDESFLAELGDDGNIDDDDFDFLGTPSEYQPSAEEQEAAKQLGLTIDKALEEYAVDDAAIPDDFDPTDRSSLKTLLSNTQRGAIQSTMKLMIPIVNHALSVATKQMKHHMESANAGKSKQSAAVEQFKSLGLSDAKQIAMARPIFAQALKASGNDPQKAAKATRRAFHAMGVTLPNAPAGGGGGGGSRSRMNNSGGSGVKVGDDALNDLFGASK